MKFQSWLSLFVIITGLLGLLLRWQLTGYGTATLMEWDLRRAHSHLGFYGVLFPVAWSIYGARKLWAPKGKLLLTYLLLCLLSVFAFLLQGYGFLAIASSTGVLIVWILFGWRNQSIRALFQKDWTAPASFSIYLSAILIPLVAVITKRDTSLANQIARFFLSLLIFGVFIPVTLRSLKGRAPHAGLWFLTSILGASFLTFPESPRVLGLALAWLGFEIARSILQRNPLPHPNTVQDLRLRMMWFVLATGFVAVGTNLFPPNYVQAIAGIHFLFLGPVLLSYLLIEREKRPPEWLRVLYEMSLLVMVSAIALQALFPSWTPILQKSAAGSGTVFFLTLAAFWVLPLRAPRPKP